MAEVAELGQDERRALVVGQAAEVGEELAQLGAALDVRGEAVEAGFKIVGRDGRLATRGDQREAAVARDA